MNTIQLKELLDLPEAKFSKEIANMPWKKVFKIYQNFVPRDDYVYGDHDQEIETLMHQRLMTIEQPIFTPRSERSVIRVRNNTPNSGIKTLVARLMKEGDNPKYVLEDCGKLRGFALSPTLIIAGVCCVGDWADVVDSAIKAQGFRELNREDCKLVQALYTKVVYMMQRAHVPSFNNVCEFIMHTGDLNPILYPVWNLDEQKVARVSWDEYTMLAAKL